MENLEAGKVWQSRDLWGSAFLMAYGFGEPTLEPSLDRAGIYNFCFVDTPELRAAYHQYRNGDDTVGAKAYRNAVRTLKRLLAERYNQFTQPEE